VAGVVAAGADAGAAAPDDGVASGRRIVNVVPLSTSLRTEIVPPCF
jgi:hypothetical protein